MGQLKADQTKLIEEVAVALEGLRSLKLETKADVTRWYGLARKLEAALVTPGGLTAEVPSVLWHYLADADIRQKDPLYAELQNRQIWLLSRYLARGEIPSDETLKECS